MSQTATLSYATRVQGGAWSGRAIRFAFLICGLAATVSLIADVAEYRRDLGLGEEYAEGLRALQRIFSPASGSTLGGDESQQSWPAILNLPIPLLLLVASLESKRRPLASAIRMARLLAAGLLIGVAVGKWRYLSFDDNYVLSLRERVSNAVRLLALDFPLIPLLIVMGLSSVPGRRAIAVALGVVLASYAASMCLSFHDLVVALFESSYHGGLGTTPDYHGIARLCDLLYEWLIAGMDETGDFREAMPPLHTLCLFWASAAGALIATACLWSRRVWLRQIAAATLLPAVIVCLPGRLLPWSDVGIECTEPGDDPWSQRLLGVGGYIGVASLTLPLTAFAMAAIVTLLSRPRMEPTSEAFTNGAQTRR